MDGHKERTRRRGWRALAVGALASVALGPATVRAATADAGAAADGGAVTSARAEGDLACEPRCMLARFAGLPDDTPLATSLLSVKALGYDSIDFLLMLVPDPKDSSFPESFDSYLGALRVAMEATDYTSDTFYDPWHDAKAPRLYRQHPGALLFRRDIQPFAARDAGTRRRDLLLVLVVGEVPTWGLHKAALANALDVINEASGAGSWPQSESRFKLRVLGPTSSGGAESLRIGLSSWINAQRSGGHPLDWQIEIISGSASSRQNQRILQTALRKDVAPVPVTFKATVNADDELWSFANNFLQRLGASPSDIALLTESNTDYGRDFQLEATKPKDKRDVALNLPFPLHIAQSRARGNEGPASAGAVALPTAIRDLQISRGPFGGYSLSTDGELTRASNELALTNILRTISGGNRKYVGILASDILDTLFLAQQVRAWFPDVTVVVFTNDLVYLHDAVSFMDGVLVASTYPLAGWSQQASFPFAGDRLRHMFASEYAQGVYNAALLLLDDKRSEDPDDPRDVADYGRPFTYPGEEIGPPLWMSVISHNAIWPLAAMDGRLDDKYTQKASPFEEHVNPCDRSAAWRLPDESGLVSLGFVVSVLAGLASFAYARGLTRKDSGDREPRLAAQLLLPSEGFPSPRMHLFGLASVFVTFAVLEIVLLPFVVLESRLASIGGGIPSITSIVTVVTLSLATAATLAMLAVSSRRLISPTGTPKATADEKPATEKKPAIPPEWAWAVRPSLLGFVVVAAIVGGLYFSFHELGIGTFNPPNRTLRLIFIHYRMRMLAGGQSIPALATMLALGFLIWIGGHLRQVRIHQSVERLRAWKVLAIPAENEPSLFNDLQLTKQSREAVNQAEKVLPPGLVMFLVFLFYVAVGALVLPGVQFYEKISRLGSLIWFFPSMYVVIVGFLFWGCYSSVATWSALRRLLSALGTHPIAASFRRIPGGLAEVFRHPWSHEVEKVWHAHCLVLYNSAKLLGRSSAAAEELIKAIGSPAAPAGQAAAPPTLEAFMEALAPHERQLATDLYRQRPTQLTKITLKPEEFDKLEAVSTAHLIRSAIPDDQQLLYRLWEEFSALRLIALIGYVRAQIYNVIGTVSLATVPILLMTMLYPLHGNRTFLVLVVSLVAAVIATTLTVFTQMNRNPLMSVIDGTTPGTITWDRSYLTGLVMHGALPLATLASVKFPAAASALRSVITLVSQAAGR